VGVEGTIPASVAAPTPNLTAARSGNGAGQQAVRPLLAAAGALLMLLATLL
jgi:hypothetical protein